MSAGNNAIRPEKKAFISNVARAIKSKLDFKISGYGPRVTQDIFPYVLSIDDGIYCRDKENILAQRMKYEFGGCQITNISELIRLFQEIGFCDWFGYLERKTPEVSLNHKMKEEYVNRVGKLRRFWNAFLFDQAALYIRRENVEAVIKDGISDAHSLKEDYRVVDGRIKVIKSVDDLIDVMGVICQNRTYFYFDSLFFFRDIFRLIDNDEEVFKTVTLEQLEKILPMQREILRDLFNLELDNDFGNMEIITSESDALLRIISLILMQSNNVKIIQRIIEWLRSFENENEQFTWSVLQKDILAWFVYFTRKKMQLELKDVSHFLELCFRPESNYKLNSDDFCKLLACALTCCSDDMSQNKSKLDLGFILNIEQVETLKFCDSNFFTFFEFLNANMDKISFSDKFIKKVFSSKVMGYASCKSLERMVYLKARYLLEESKDQEETKKCLISLQATIDFMLKNSLTKDTKKDGDAFVISLASLINRFKAADKDVNKLVVGFVFKILKDNKMPDREKLFIQTLLPELRPEITSMSHEPETKNLNDELKHDSHGNTEANLQSSSENSQIVATQNKKEESSHKNENNLESENSNIDEAKSNQAKTSQMPIGAKFESDNVIPETGPYSKNEHPNRQISGQQENTYRNSVLNSDFSQQIEDLYFKRSQNCHILSKSANEIYNLLVENLKFCRNVCMLEGILEKKKYQSLSTKLTPFQRFRVAIYYYVVFWWKYRQNNKMDFSQPNMKDHYSSRRYLGEKSVNYPRTYPLDQSK